MKPGVRLILRVLAAVSLLASACGGDDDTASTTSESSTPTSGSTTSESPTTSEPATSSTSTTTEPAGTVTLYFSTDDGSDCGEVSPFTRSIDDGEPGLEQALVELLAGPNPDETAAGAGSFFSAATADSLEYVDLARPDLAVIGFGDLQPLIPNASTSCGSEALLAQLNQTVLQYVPRARYEMLGSCQKFGEWLQRECMEFTSDGGEPADLTTLERASGSGCTPKASLLPDGRWFGFVGSANESELGFDLACWFDGDAAVDAAAEDGEESPPPNDYYIRNDNDTIRTVPLTSSATVSWLPNTGDPSTQTTVSVAEWVSERDTRDFQPGVWIVVRDGWIVEVSEQYVP